MARHLWGGLGVVGGFVGALVACSSDVQTANPIPPGPTGDDAGSESGAEADSATTPTIQLSVEGPKRVLVGGNIEVNVVVQRTGAVPITGPVHVVFSGVSGLSVDAIDIDEQHSTGTAKIAVPATSKHGRFTFLVEASTQGASPITGSSTFKLLVAGPPGSLDNSFGTDGVFTFTQASTVTGLVADAGHVYLGGVIGTAPAIIGLQETGALETSFGAAGIFRPSFTGTVVSTSDLVGSVTSGFFLGATLNGASHKVGTLFGASGTGTAVAGFGTSGTVSLMIQTAERIALAPPISGVAKGSILVAGRPDATLPAAGVQVVQPDGTPSAKYGTAPINVIDDCPFAGSNETCIATALSSSVNPPALVLATYRRDGSNVQGVAFDGTTQVAGAGTSLQVEQCRALLIDKGKTYVAGIQGDHAVVARYSVGEGLPDDTFVGRESMADFSTQHLREVVDFYPQADGTFVAGVKTYIDDATGKIGFAVCRLKQDGSLDTTFAAPVGCAYQDVAGLKEVKRMVVDSDQRLLIVGNNGQMVGTRFWQ